MTMRFRYSQLQQQSFNIQQVAFQHQQIKSTVETVAVMKAGMQQMKKDMKPLRDIGKLESMMDEMSDLMMDANEARCPMSFRLPLFCPPFFFRPPFCCSPSIASGARVPGPLLRSR
jgi:hypothetical protein